MLVGGSGGTLAGRVVSDTGEAIPLPATSRMRVAARPVDPTSTYTSFDNDNGRVKDDWTFELTNVYGQNKISINPMPTGWAVRRIEHDGKDYADIPVELHGGQKLDGVTIVLSKTLPRFQGMLLDEQGRPAEATALLFPEDGARWGEDSRRARTARPDAAGGFEFRNVIPGDYLTIALEYVRDGDWTDPDFVERLRERDVKVQVDDKVAPPAKLTLRKAQ